MFENAAAKASTVSNTYTERDEKPMQSYGGWHSLSLRAKQDPRATVEEAVALGLSGLGLRFRDVHGLPCRLRRLL